MNIVYALSGEGRGHASTARAILPVLERAGHRVKVVTYGRSLEVLRDYDPIEIRGIRHHYNRAGRLSVAGTVIGNAGVLGSYATQWASLRRRLRDFSPDLFVVNFEPFTPLIARSLGVPVVSFDNQHALVYVDQPVPPGFRLSCLVTKTAARLVAGGASAYVVMSFLPATRFFPNVHLVSPVVQDEFRYLRPVTGDYVVVYLKERNPRLLEILRRMNQRFVVYGYQVDRNDGNLAFRTFNDGMPAEMAGGKAVIGTSGLSLITEAVWLKKPFFGVPLKGEFEQTANAMFVRGAGLGDFAEAPSRRELESFFTRLDHFQTRLARFQFDPDAAGRMLLDLAAGQARTSPVPAPVLLPT